MIDQRVNRASRPRPAFRRPGPFLRLLAGGILVLGALAGPLRAAEWYVAPGGMPTGKGTIDSPWDVESALGGKQQVRPGDTLWLRRGTYKAPWEGPGLGYPVRLAGRENAPIQVRAYPGERVTVDGGLNVQPPSAYLWVRDLEILVSEPRPEKPVPPDPHYQNLHRPEGGLNVYAGAGCKYIHLVIHDNCQGVSFWTGAKDSELYGCLIYDNGWAGTDRGHGHAVYTQNNEGTKTIADCIMTGGYGYSLHAYGSKRADVNNYRVEGNLCYRAGPFLIGGGKPSRHIRVLGNCLYDLSMQIGYDAPSNEDCEVRDTVIVNGGLTIQHYREVVNENNLVLGKNAPRPAGTKVILRPSKYDPDRAHLAVFNWDRKPGAVDLGGVEGFLKPGDRYRLLDPRDFFGKPVLTGTFDGRPVRAPVAGEFAAFVVLKERAR